MDSHDWMIFLVVPLAASHLLPVDSRTRSQAQHTLRSQNLDLYLINEGKKWYISDAGGFDSWLDPHATKIVEAVKQVIPAEQKLTHVLCATPHYSHHIAISLFSACLCSVLRCVSLC